MVAIVILMLCGRKRVGFLSGAPFHKSVELVESDETSLNSDFFPIKSPSPALSTNTNDGCCGVHQSTWVRATFILSGAIIILFAILLVTQGLTNLQSTVTTFHQSSVDIGSLAAQAENIINTRLISIRGLASSTRNSLSQEINGSNFCPADPNLNNNQVAHDIRAQANEAVSVLGKLDSILQAPVDNVYNALRQVAKGAQQVQSGTENVDFIGWEALVILIPGTIVPCILVAAAILAQFDVEFPMFTCVINWFVMPLFIIMVIFYAAVASLMIAGAAINSDFCLPGGRPEDSYPGTSPDTTVYRVLDAYGYTTPAQFVRQIANYYVAQCQNVEDPYAFMTDYLPNLVRRLILIYCIVSRMFAPSDS